MTTPSTELVVQNAQLRRGAFSLSASFRTPLDGITVVFGPSGAGKSMLLGMLAGLHRPQAGHIEMNGVPLDDASLHVPTHRRGIGMVFQDARLFPHLSVRGNLHYAQRRAPKTPAAPALDAVAEQLEIADLLDRRVRGLSGGEKSRVALARALLSAPDYLLLDEPFAALDGRRRRAFLILLRKLCASMRLSMMVVTHQVEDVAELADHVVAMKAGEVVASGSASDVMDNDAFLSLLDARDLGARVDVSTLTSGGRSGAGVWVRADNVLLAAAAPYGLSARHVWEGRLTAITDEGDGARLAVLETKVGRIRSRVTAEAVSELELTEGKAVWAVVKTHAL